MENEEDTPENVNHKSNEKLNINQQAIDSKDEEKVSQTEKEEVKSIAIVKCSVPKPAQFMKLKYNTDLNLPPSNWLSSSIDFYGLQHVLSHQKGFSSFRMAHMFPDCVGEVDVVTDAENIKKLLKIPYDKKQVSMVIHRVENTLLLDNLDVYEHLLRSSKFEWRWFKKFYFENINQETCEEDRSLYIKDRRREALKQKSLVSKFYYHSLIEDGCKEHVELEYKNTLPIPLPGPRLPEPVAVTPDSTNSDHKYNHTVVWSFENIEMFIGSDLPIFGGGTHPCVSLRLRDVSKPINVLTGIDYWLDNLMCNVPEVLMCYHLNGIVQNYEVLKTEDLPRLNDSKFSPKLIRDVAQSILSFLKSNVTKAGHTYWLFKGKNEDYIKLYDLTSLCSEKDMENGQNPFTVPVGMLLYRVARNMKHTSDRRQPGTIRMLLKNCIKLLSEEKYPEIVTSSHYMLSDLYVPADTNPESPELDQVDAEDNDSVYDDDFDYDNKESPTKILVLGEDRPYEKFSNHYKSPPPITGSVEERCLQSIQHVAAGLNCLKYFPMENRKFQADEEVHMARPFEPIPMPYSKLDNNKEDVSSEKKNKKNKSKKKHEPSTSDDKVENALLLKNIHDPPPLPTWQNGKGATDIPWKDHLKTLLYEKAMLTYAVLSEHYFATKNYGSSLRTTGLLARCQLVMNHLLCTSSVSKEICLLGRAGDCCIMMVQNWNKIDSYQEQYQNHSDEDLKMMEQLERDEQQYNINIGESNVKCVFIYEIRTIEQMLLQTTECYEQASKYGEDDSILRRLGNSLNEVASFFLNKARVATTGGRVIELCKKAESYLQKGLNLFEKIKDEANTALLYTNRGHLHRLLAHGSAPENTISITTEQIFQFNKAVMNYKKALQVLGDREHNVVIWDAVSWELSTTLFNMATIMHDYPPSNVSKKNAEKQVIEALQKVLQYCDLDEENPKYPLYVYRVALIHYRIGNLYHNHIWSTDGDVATRKKIIQLAKINYEKASKHYFQSSEVMGYLKSQMQRIALFEHLSETTSAPNAKLKHLQHILNIFVELNDMVRLLVEKKLEVPEEESEKKAKKFETFSSILNLIKQQLQSILKTLVKLCLTKPPFNKDCLKLTDIYKSCYVASFELKDGESCEKLLHKLYKVLTLIGEKIREIEGISV